MSTTSTDIPGYVVRRWTIDPVHSELSFTVRHLMVSKVRGRFGRACIVTVGSWSWMAS